MLIESTRFGTLEIDESRILHFADGLLGFPEHRNFAIVQTSTEPVFFWMQSVDDPGLAFVVCDPLTFVPDYQAPIRAEEVRSIGLEDLKDAQVLVIVNKVDGWLTANLMGPLVVAAGTLQGKQLVLADKRYSTRHRLLEIRRPEPASLSA